MTHQLEELREKLQDPIRDLSIQLSASMAVTGKVSEKLYEWEKELEDKVIQLIAQHDAELLGEILKQKRTIGTGELFDECEVVDVSVIEQWSRSIINT